MNWSVNKTLKPLLALAAIAAVLLVFFSANGQTTNPMAYQFEWHWWKNLKNRWKHGIWFADAAKAFNDPDGFGYPAKTVDGEPRHTQMPNMATALLQSPTRYAAQKSESSRRVPHAAKNASNTPLISAAEFDRRFDAGEDMSDYIDWEKGLPGKEYLRKLGVS